MTAPHSNLESFSRPAHVSGSTAWLPALTLRERLFASPTTIPPAPVPPLEANPRYRRWRANAPLLTDGQHLDYFAALGFDAATLAALLAEPDAALAARADHLPGNSLDWRKDLEDALTYTETLLNFTGQAAFLRLAEPMLVWAARRLAHRLEPILALPGGPQPDLPSLQQQLLSTLAGQLGPFVERTLVLEMHVARLQGQLSGDTPDARFASFTQRLADPAARRALLEEYPVLARRLINRSRQTADALAELIERLVHDWPQLIATFFPDQPPGPLSEVSLGEGDTHHDGRTVAVLTFAHGQKLVYKPRPLDVDVAFQHLLEWLNTQGATPAFRTLSVLTRDTYGWVEFVHAAPCTDTAQIDRFYRRQGGYLALLHLLYAGDFHFENLLAAGEHPILIDLEALFHPTLLDYDEKSPEHLAQRAMDDSVLSVGMLPQRLQFAGGTVAVDISGLGASGTQMTPDKLPTWEGAGTDEMRMQRRHLEFVTDGNRATLDTSGHEPPVSVAGQGQAVAAGFAHIYDLLRRQRADLQAPGGPLSHFEHTQVRVVARATRIYSLLLQENNHPDLLRNGAESDALFARLWQETIHIPRLAHLVAAEVRDLHNGDVPIFHTTPASHDIYDSHGNSTPAFLTHSGMARVLARLNDLNETDLARQLWYIHASFATVAPGDGHTVVPQLPERPALASPGPISSPPATPDITDFLGIARALGDRLEQTAYRTDDHAVWIGLGLDQSESWSLKPLTMHLYDGHAGVALFLAYLGHTTGENRYTALARAALRTLQAQISQQRATFHYPGAFSGWGGIIYTFAHLGSLWREPDLWEQAAGLAQLAAGRIPQDEQFDLIGGAAGFIPATAVLFACSHDQSLIPTITTAADHLLAHAAPQSQGVGWLVPHMGDRCLGGFSHGAAGMAFALYCAAQLTGNPAYAECAHAALTYDRTLYEPASHNWRDLRGASTDTAVNAEPAFMHAWCHGAPGIGLSRLALLQLLHSPDAPPIRSTPDQLTAEIDAALVGTLEAGFGLGHSLCHGDFGNLELLITAAEILGRPELLVQARNLAGRILAAQPATGWYCGVPGGIETPGLMVGLAGIGYALLRLHDPAALPNLLLLQPPLTSQ